MFWDDLIRRWRRDNRQLGRRLLAGAAGYVAVAPSRPRRSRVTLVLLIAAVGLLLALAVATGRAQSTTHAPDDPGAAIVAVSD
jgi:hypothetical protein